MPMSERTEMVLFMALAAGCLATYVGCGAFVAWLFGMAEWSLTWVLFVATWPAPIAMLGIMASFAMTVALSVARAMVR